MLNALEFPRDLKSYFDYGHCWFGGIGGMPDVVLISRVGVGNDQNGGFRGSMGWDEGYEKVTDLYSCLLYSGVHVGGAGRVFTSEGNCTHDSRGYNRGRADSGAWRSHSGHREK